MFPDNIGLITTAIMVGSAYKTLHDSATDKELADHVIEGANKYLNKATTEEKIAIRMTYIQVGLKTAPRRIVTEEALMQSAKESAVRSLLGKKDYAVPIVRKVLKAIEMCSHASDIGDYFGVIEVERCSVTIAMLPWAWGFMNFTWQFKPQHPKSEHRDYFMLIG